MAQHVCSRHRVQHIQKTKQGNSHSESRCRHNGQHQHRGQHDAARSLNRSRARTREQCNGHGHGNGHGHNRDNGCRSGVRRRHSLGCSRSRDYWQTSNHGKQCQHRQHHHQQQKYRYGLEGSDDESSESSSEDSRFAHARRGGHWEERPHSHRAGRSSKRDKSRSKRSKSLITPMDYGSPNRHNCKAPWSGAYDTGPYQHPTQQPTANPQQNFQQMPPPQQSGQAQGAGQQQQQPQQQQQQQQKPPPPELEELRKNVFKGIKEFRKSLRKQRWYGDVDYVRSSRKVKHGHKNESLEKHRKESRRRDWVQHY